MVKKIVFHILIQYGYTVLEAQNPQEAILICEQYKGVINLLITDVVMPEMNGYDLARKIISLYPEIKILFVSGYTEDVLYQRGVLGMDSNFLQKPFTSYSLVLTVREILDSSKKKIVKRNSGFDYLSKD